jgi:transposase
VSSSKEFYLSDSDFEKLREITKNSTNSRERERAQTLLVLHKTRSTSQTALVIGIHEKTVGSTRRAWLDRRYESLLDRPRCGAPKKITAEQLRHLREHATQIPCTSKELLAHHIESGGIKVHFNTIVSNIKALGFSWKRTRHSLKKKEMRMISERLSKR